MGIVAPKIRSQETDFWAVSGELWAVSLWRVKADTFGVSPTSPPPLLPLPLSSSPLSSSPRISGLAYDGTTGPSGDRTGIFDMLWEGRDEAGQYLIFWRFGMKHRPLRREDRCLFFPWGSHGPAISPAIYRRLVPGSMKYSLFLWLKKKTIYIHTYIVFEICGD